MKNQRNLSRTEVSTATWSPVTRAGISGEQTGLFAQESLGDNPMVAFTDGGCMPHPGHGGAAYILKDSAGRQIEARGFYLGENTTNNIGEFVAVRGCPVGS